MSVNKVILIGNVGNDPEVKYVQEDVPVARFSLATSESFKKDGERITNTEWHNIVIWRGLAKVVEQYVKKGSKLYIEGKLTTRSYEKDGQTKYFTEIVAREMRMLDSRPQNDSYQSSSTSSSKTTNSSSSSSYKDEPVSFDSEDMDNIDDLPF